MNSPVNATNDYEQGVQKIKERCAAAKLAAEESKGFIEETCLHIDIPAGPTTRRVTIAFQEDVDAFRSITFEKFRFIEDYNAITDYSTGVVEAAVRLPAGLGLPGVYKTLFGKKVPANIPSEKLTLEEGDAIAFADKREKSTLNARLGPMSKDFAAFATVCMWNAIPFTLRITGAGISKNSEALELLEKIANALFFEIDLVLGIPLILDKERKLGRPRKGGGSTTGKQLLFPTTEHDARPMSLYWYARLSRGMPLLQFLAYYQVVEFYYPMFSEKEAIHRLKIILKDPRFDIHNDGDVSKIIRTIKPSTRGFGSELSQLQATIRACVDPKDLRAFLAEDEDRKSFFETNYKVVTKQQIPLKNTAADLFAETAQRLYEIRCRIVHTKDSFEEIESEPLLPFSREAEQLHYDIELMAFVAKKVLITASQKFHI